MDDEKLEIWKRRLIEIEEKVKQINNHKSILVNAIDELKRESNAKLINLLQGVELQEEVSYLDDWIGFYKEKIAAYENKINALNKDIAKQKLEKLKEIEKDAKGDIKILFGEEKRLNIFENVRLHQNSIIRFGIPIILLLAVISVIFVSKPEITGYATLSKETTYNESLNLRVNESINYTWALDNPAKIKSIKATGSVIGNGSVKIFIEKNGERYLIYKNK